MCNISKPTKLKTKTVYKLVYKIPRGESFMYFAYYSGMELKLGKVNENFMLRSQDFQGITLCTSLFIPYIEGNSSYNENMQGKSSGFEKYKLAKILYDAQKLNETDKITIIKLKLGGEIMQGTTEGIISCHDEEWVNGKTFAGSEILSIEEC